MYILISTTRTALDITDSIHLTQKAAYDAMVADMILMTDYKSEEEIIEAAKKDLCGLSDNAAWAETNQLGTGQWKIIELPNQIQVETPEGFIYAEAKGTKDEFPGIWICNDKPNLDNIIAIVDYNTEDKRIQTEVCSIDSDAPIAMFDYKTGDELM